MARFIDADLLKTKFDYNENDQIQRLWKPKGVLNIIDACPTADVVSVIHAEWVRGKIGYSCSNCSCGDDFVNPSTCYCPSCGAKMDLNAIGTVEYEKEGTK